MKKSPDNVMQFIDADEQMIIKNYGGIVTKDTTNGDIFSMTRSIEEDALKGNVKLKNTVNVYFWFIKYRDAIVKRDAAKKAS